MMERTLSPIIQRRLDELGGKSLYWLAAECGYPYANLWSVLHGTRAIPDLYLEALVLALGWQLDSAEGQQVVKANNVQRTLLHKSGKESVADLQLQAARLQQELNKATTQANALRAEISELREQRATTDQLLFQHKAQIAELVEANKAMLDQLASLDPRLREKHG